MTNNVVSFNRSKEKDNDEIIGFIGEKRFVIMTFDDDERIDLLSNFYPGLAETVLIHAAYLFALNSITVDE
jgi:hypothetical protein